MKNIRLGIIGTNFVSDWLCDSVKIADGIELSAVYSRTLEKGKAFAEKHSIPVTFTDMEAFLNSELDAVYVASPNFCHFEQAKRVLEKGLHLLLEKPATLEKSQFEELISLAEKKGIVLLEAMRPVHDPALDEIKKGIEKIGTLRRAVFEYCQYSSRYDAFRRGEILNAFNPKFGNASVMDLGCYAIAVCVSLFGKPLNVVSSSHKLHNGFEGMGKATLDYGFLQADVVWAKICESSTPSHITGEDGSVLIGKVSTLDYVDLALRGKEKQKLVSSRDGLNMIYEVEHFVEMVNGKLSPKPYHEITLTMLGIIDEIRAQNEIVFE